MSSMLMMWSFLVFLVFIPVSVFTATFTTIPVPLCIAPLASIPRPDSSDSQIEGRLDLYSKATIYDDLTRSMIYDLDRVFGSEVHIVASNILVLEARGFLSIDQLFAFNCTTWCLDLQISEITRVTGKTMENLKGNPDPITMFEMHNLIVQTLEDIYCFNMTVIEQRLNMSALVVLENQWALFVPEIVREAVQCRANILGVTVSELAELLRTDVSTLLGYTLDDITNTFFPNFALLQARKNIFETRSLAQAYAFASLTPDQGQAETMLTFAGHSSIAFNLRDLEILYDWQKPQLYAIENVPLSSYLSGGCSVITSNSLFAVSTVLFGQGTTEPTCNVAYILSRSLNEVEAKFNSLTPIENRNPLYIFMTPTAITSWFDMDGILQLDIDEGIWVEIPSVSHVASAAGLSTSFIKTCSLPEVIASLKNSNGTGALGPFLVINNPTFRNLLLTTYGYSYNQLNSLTQTPESQLSSLPVVELHAIILEALAHRYSISNLPLLLNVPGVVDMHILSTLPSFEWSRIVRAVIESSFAHSANALSVNLAATGSNITVTNQDDGSPSIEIRPSSVFFSPRVTTSTLATCLLGRNETDIYAMTLPDYHNLFSVNIIPIVRGKITIESTSFESLLAQDNLVLRQVWNRTVADVIAQYTDLTAQQLGCLYGWDQSFLDFITGITWEDVSAFRLCSEYELLTLHQILVQLSTAPVVNCFGTISLSSTNYNVEESAGSVIVSVELVGGEVDDVVEVSLSVSPLTASSGADFQQITTTTVTFQPRETGSKSVVINIANDDIVENDEQFQVFITSSDADTRVLNSTATVTILDDDFVSLSWQVPDNSVSESVGAVTASLVLNGEIEKNIPVSIAVNDISTASADYTLITTAVTFTPSDASNSKPVLLVINNDEIVEQPESLILVPSTTDTSVNTTTTVILILDNDRITVSFEEATYSFAENIRDRQIEVTAVAQQLDTTVQVSLSTAAVTASLNVDFINPNTILTFTPFSVSQTQSFTVQILPDSLIENDETFEVELSIPSQSASLAQLGTPSETAVTIVDDDRAEINFQRASYTVDESATNVDVTVTLSGVIQRPVTIGYTTVSSTASNTDFTPSAATITFQPGGSTVSTFQIPIVNDNFVEASEQFRVILQLQDPVNTAIGSVGETTVTINDNDKAQVEHVSATYAVNEDDVSAVLGVRLVNLAGPLQTNVDVGVTAVGSPTQDPGDYTAPNPVLTFVAGESNNQVRNIIIPLTDDGIFELDEDILVILSAGSDDKVTVNPPVRATVTISDDDVAQISFTSNLYSVTEGETAAVMVEVTNGTLGSPVTVSVTAQPATAENSDFRATITSVTFQPGETGPKTVNFLTVDDDIVESSELFTVSLSSDVGISLGASASVLIEDNDDVIVQFASVSSSVSEGSGNTTVQLSALGQREIPITVSASTQDDSATASNDYVPKTESITFQPDEILKDVEFTIINDQRIEEGESFKVVLSAGSSQVTLGSVREHTIQIVDDDFATVQFTSAFFIGNETHGSVDLWVTLTGVLEDPTTVSVSTQQDTAVAGADYITLTNSPLTFTPGGETLQHVTVNITDDDFIEGTERFTASLSTASSFTRIGSINETTVRIIDNDVASLGFTNNLVLRQNEGTVAFLTVELTGPLTTQVSAAATIVTTSASSGDYNVISPNDLTDLTFSPGNTVQNIVMSLVQDTLIEGDEVFSVVLSTTNSNVQINDGVTTVTILNDDNAIISLSQGSYQGSEDSPVVEVSINLISSGTLETVVQASLVLSPNTAALGDYLTLDNPTVVFSPGSQTTERRNITIVDDNVVENLETFRVNLEAVSNNVLISPTSTALISISDNDEAIFGFSPSSYAVNELSQSANLTVQLFTTSPLQRTVIFRYSTINNTARSPGDYDEIQDGILQFDAGDGNGAVRSISIGINDDAIIEDVENFQVRLTPVTSDTVTTDTASVSIIDNDVPTIRWIQTTLTTSEDDVQVIGRALLTGDVDRVVTARATTSDVTATANSDYQSINQEITFNVGENLKDVPITINEDTLVEGNEMFRVILTSDDAAVNDPTFTVTISDDDFVNIAFQQNTQDVPETQSAVAIPIVLTGNRAVPITFAINTIAGTATDGQDYTGNRQEITINTNDPSTYVVSIPINNDNIVEGDETFRVQIDDSFDLVTNDGATLQVTIQDDDTANVMFSQPSYTFGESDTQGTVTIEIDRSLETTAIVSVSSTASTATPGVDFVSIANQQVVFVPGVSSRTISVNVLPDEIVEANEVFSLGLTTQAGSPLTVGTPGTTLITIDDDDVAFVKMDMPSYTHSENDQTANVEVELTATVAVARPLTFRIFTGNGTAYSPRDFTHLDQTGVFNPGAENGAKLSFSVVISDDAVVENTESFYVQLVELDPALQVINPNRSTVFIQDNDAFEAQFTHGGLTVNEEDGSVQVSVRLNGQHERAVTIRLTTTPNSATAGVDYESVVRDLQFSPGNFLQTVDITLRDDLIIEGTETFQVRIDSDDAQVRIVEPQTITVTILDTDVATVSFNQTEYRVNENVGTSAIWVELKNDLELNAQVSVEVFTFPNTATSPADYTVASSRVLLTFRGGDTKLLPVNFNVVDDEHVENVESFYGLINPDQTTVRGEEPVLVLVYIEDNDVAIVGFTQPLYRVNEDQNAVVEIELQNTLAVSVTVSIRTSTGSAGLTDFGEIARMDLTFDPGETRKQVEIQIRDDLVVEDDEEFVVSLETTHPRVVFSRSTTTVRIEDNDSVNIAFRQPLYIVNEDDGSVQISYSIFGTTAVTLTYQVHIDPGSARLGFDYVGTSPITQTIAPGTTENAVSIQLVNDQNIESNETFSLRLDNLNNARIGLLNPSTTTVLILDDDAATVEFARRQYSVLEDAVSVTVTLNLTGILDENTTVSVSSQSGTAIGGLDYTDISSKELTFIPGGPTEQDIVVGISNDNLLEGTEVFLLTVSSQNANTRIGNYENTTVRIFDDDVVSVDFVETTDDVSEQDGAIVVVIEIQGDRTRPVTVRVQSVSLTAQAPSDFTAIDTTVTFQTTETTKTVTVPIAGDARIENDEMFVLNLSTDDDQVRINVDEMRITILDNDVAAIRFEQQSYNVAEGDGDVTLGILLVGDLDITVSAEVEFSPQTAVLADFTVPLTRTVVFAPGSNRADITVNITDDNVVEATELFLADLTPIGDKVILGSPQRTTVLIEDNDNALVRFTRDTRDLNEDAGILNMTIQLVTTSPLQRDVSVRFSTEEASAESPEDFSDVAGSTVIFREGDANGATQYGIVSIANDNIVEGIESFTVRLTSIDSGLIPTTFESATIRIIDNDRATLAFAQTSYTVNEQGNSVGLLVLLTGTIARTVTARISTSNIDAIGGNDYGSITNRQISFSPGGGATQTVSVTIRDDTTVENNERFRATLTAENGVDIRPGGGEATVTIVDNDVVTVSLEASQVDVTEDSDNAVVLVRASGAREREIRVNVTTYDVSAIAVLNDYEAKSELVTLQPNDIQIQFPVNILDDDIVENTEQFGVRVTSTDPQVNIQNGDLQVSINDNDKIILSMGNPSYQVDENDGSVNVEVVVTGRTAVDIAGSTLTTNDLSARSPDDYAATTRTILVTPSSSSSFTFSISIQNDNTIESTEFFQALLSTTNTDQVDIGTPSSSSITISDDDALIIAFEQRDYVVSEDDGTITVGVTVAGSTDLTLQFGVTATDGSATTPADYVLLDSTKDLTPGTLRQTIRVRLTDDLNLENNETFTLNLNNGGDTRVRVVNGETTILILDDDAVTVQFVQDTYTVNEDDNSVNVSLSIAGVLEDPATVRVSSRNNTAFAGVDYVRIDNNEVTFIPGGPSVQNLTVEIMDDDNLEGTESFFLDLSSSVSNVEIGDKASTTIRINDEDSVSVDFVLTLDSVLESRNILIVEVEIHGQRSVPINVRVQSNNLDAIAGEDYDAVNEIITFQPSDTEKSLFITIRQDVKVENNERFVLILTTDDDGVTIGDNVMTITIADDDVATVRLEQNSYTVNESVVSFTIGVILAGDVSIPVDASVALTPGTAVLGDYTLEGNGGVTFNPGETEKQIRVFISDDEIVESVEQFQATLSAGAKAVVVTPSEAQVFIQDNDDAQVRFESSTYSANEANRTATLTVVLQTNQPLGRVASVSYSTQDETAVSVGNVDYDRVSGSLVVFNQGATNGSTQQISIPIIDDSRTESTETFTVTLSETSGGGLVPVTPSTATVNVIDDDDVIIRFASDSYNVVEGTGTVSVTVLRVGINEIPITAFLTLQPGTATLADYTGSPTTITFNPLDSSIKTIPISITTDDIVEGTETFTASLVAGTGAVVAANGGTATITIFDDDVLTIVMEANPSTVDEDDGTVTVIVRAVGGLQRTINLNVFTFDISASSGSDYVSKNEIITLDSTNIAASFVVTIVDNQVVENTETFGVNVTTDESQVFIQDETIVITILDEDQLTLAIAQPSYTVAEDAGVLSVSVTVTGETDIIVTGSLLSTNDGTAKNGEDYTSVPQNLVIVPGDSNKNAAIVIRNDQLTEGIENFVLQLSTTNNNQIAIGRSTSLVIIQDNDVARVQFLNDRYYVNETDNSVRVAVVLTGTVAQSITVRVDTSQDSAQNVLDFVPIVSNLLTFTVGGDVIQFVDITIRDDNFIEGPENFTATLTSLSSLATIGSVSTTTITILDNDVAGIGFDLSQVTVPENGGIRQIAVTSTANLNTPVTVRISVAGITASTSDYTVANDIELTFTPSGPSTQFFSFTPTDDDRVENNETVLATLSTTDRQAEILTNQVQITIEDNDKADVRLQQSTVQVNEGDGIANIGVLLTGTLEVPVTVNLAATGLTATENADFTFNDQTVQFQPGDNQETRQVVINNDNAVESTEFFSVVLTSNDGKVEIQNPDTTVISINDNDDASLFFQSANYSASEDEEEATLTVVLATSVPLQRPVSASFTFTNGTAVSPEDFPSSTTATVTFNIGDNNLDTRNIVIPIVDDSIFEPVQTFRVNIVSSANVLNPGTAIVSIQDNDFVTVQFSRDAYYFNEDEVNPNIPLLFVFASIPLQRSLTIGLASEDNSAVANLDYAPLFANNPITISPSDDPIKLVPVNIINDALFEEEENFRVRLSTTDPSVNILGVNPANVFITDDDDAVVSFQRDAYFTTEDSGSVEICVNTSTVLRDAIVVRVATTDIGTALPSFDYESFDQSLNLTSTVPVCITINVLQDLLIEGSEVFYVELTTTNPRVEIPRRLASVSITDDDVNECTDRTHDCHPTRAFCTDTEDSFTCTCLPGYTGDGRNCIDIDECVLNRHNCDANANCTNNVGSYGCVCKHGFTGDGFTCLDIIDCDPNPNMYPCHRFANCTDIPGSFLCSCTIGYVGDGYNLCSDIDECMLGTHDCASVAACLNTRGTFVCQCPNGYFGDGKTCTDIDECDAGTDLCDNNAECENTIGSHNCSCLIGYSGNGRVCTNIDECLTHPCDGNATCFDTPGTFTCECNAGFTGDGVTCSDIDECANAPCHERAMCTNIPGTYDCMCNSGYTGDGRNSCRDNNECDLGTDNCHVNATCQNTPGSFNCTCLNGFVGDGVVCQNDNECTRAVCHEYATCYDTIGSFRCECNEGFTGDGLNCQDIINCIPTSFDWPCHQRATCADQPPGSFTCTCLPGYSGDGLNCDDVDECALGLDDCSAENSECRNNPGSFRCECKQGYIEDTNGNCIDFNECTDVNPCNVSTSNCTNIQGSHICICKDGFEKNSPNSDCYDINECDDPSTNNCHRNAICSNTFGGYDCDCKPGFAGDGVSSCLDIDECQELDPCHANADCNNTEGNYTCTCKMGYEGDGVVSCTDINECPDACVVLATCSNSPGSFSCQCNRGYTGDGKAACTDIDECTDPTICVGGNCENTVGNYTCTCNEGYDQQGNECIDIDECVQTDLCPDNSECRNHPGLFNCVCNPGYEGPDCMDIDECNDGADNCHDMAQCTNTDGNFTCECNQGYSGDGQDCRDINECDEGTDNCHDNATCVNAPATFDCRCKQGFNGTGVDCQDDNECEDMTHDCSDDATCTNNLGSFDCTCNAGFTGDGRQCDDILECAGLPCDTNAACMEEVGSFSCQCNSGFTGNGTTCEDIPECENNPCEVNATCQELPGSFQCNCDTGFIANGSFCEDINECNDQAACHTDARCDNNIGSFTCTCNEGFTGNGMQCDDIDECDPQPGPCDNNATCTNSAGSYSCQCRQGFTGDGSTCTDIMECGVNNPCHVNATCTEEVGSFSCVCKPGFSGNGIDCENINECVQTDLCHSNATCLDLIGTHGCTCNSGYSGNGTFCTDIDECDTSTDNCHEDAVCRNTDGGFDCTCNGGYSGDGVTCTDDDECTANTHNCSPNASCSNLPGTFSCTCKPGFNGTGETCADIDECQSASSPCHINAVCANNQGSYTCTCKNGFRGNGRSCVEIDECAENPNLCPDQTTCENTYGSYRCNCRERGQNFINQECTDVLYFNLQFVIQNETFTDNLLSQNNEDYLELKSQLENSVDNVYRSSEKGSFYIAPARLQSFSQGPGNTVVANFSLFFNPAVRDMSQSDVVSLFISNLVTVNGQSVLEPHFELSDSAAGDYNECSFIPSVCRSDQLCQNYPGTYRCYCSSPRGLDINGVCRDVITYQNGITLDIPYLPEYSNPNSLLFLQLAEDIQFQLDRHFRMVYGDAYRGSQVTALSPGSVIVTYLVFFEPGTNVTQNGNSILTNLNNTLNTTNNGVFLGNFRVDPVQLTQTDYDECNPSNLVHRPDCDENANCTNVLSTYQCVCRTGYEGDGTTCTAIPQVVEPNPPKDDLWWLVYAIVFGIAFLVILMLVLFLCCLENAEENKYLVESTTLVSDRNKYFFHNESVGIVNPDIEMSTTRSGVNQQAIYTINSTAHSRMESYKVNPMFHETKSQGEQSSIGEKSSVSAGQEGYVAL